MLFSGRLDEATLELGFLGLEKQFGRDDILDGSKMSSHAHMDWEKMIIHPHGLENMELFTLGSTMGWQLALDDDSTRKNT